MEIYGDLNESVAVCGRRMKKKAVFAYGVNLDSVRTVGLGEAGELSRFLPGIKERMQEGEGGEIRVSRKTFYALDRMLQKGSLRIGGQAGNMALDGAKLGVKGYMHTPSSSKKMLSLFPKKVFVASGNGFAPSVDSGNDSEPPVHLVCEYRKGKGIPSSNRFIASFENLNPSLCIDPVFSRNIEREIPGIDRAFVAGFHLLTPVVFKKRFGEVVKQIRLWKRLNRALRIHLEWGDFVSKETERMAAKIILPEIDCVGFNENEMEGLVRAAGRIKTILRGTKTVLLHTRDYSLAFSREFGGKSLADSLSFASCVAGFKASRGRSPTFAELMKTRFGKRKVAMPDIEAGNFSVGFSPSAEVKPKYTIGLGDCFSMAFFLTLR